MHSTLKSFTNGANLLRIELFWDSPLRQFCRENFQGYNTFKNRKEHKEGYLSSDLIDALDEKDMNIDQIRESTLEELSYVLDVRKNIA